MEMTKKQILDITGVTMGGSSKPGIRELAELMTDWGGKQESTLFCFGGKVPVPVAAQVNASMGHALDYDDTGAGPTHPSVVIVPTCLVMGERQGNFSGQDLIAAVAVGTEIMCRMGQAFRLGHLDMPSGGHPGAGWHLTTLYGYIARSRRSRPHPGPYRRADAQCHGHRLSPMQRQWPVRDRRGPDQTYGTRIFRQRRYHGRLHGPEGHHGRPCSAWKVRWACTRSITKANYNSAALTEDLGRTYLSLGIHRKTLPPAAKAPMPLPMRPIELAPVHKVDASRIKEITLYCGNANSVLIAPLKKKNPAGYGRGYPI